MKRIIFAVAIAGVLTSIVIALLVSGGGAEWNPRTTMTFAGYTAANTNMPGTNACFGFQKIPKETTAWSTIEISELRGGAWVRVSPLPTPSFAWFNSGPSNYALAATVPVSSTNSPTRVVVELTRSKKSIVREVIRFIRGVVFGSRANWSPPLNDGPKYYMTNEFGGKGP